MPNKDYLLKSPITIAELKQGDFFILSPLPIGKRTPKESQVYIRKEYDRSERKYWCQKWSDISDGKYLKGDRVVFTDFEF